MNGSKPCGLPVHRRQVTVCLRTHFTTGSAAFLLPSPVTRVPRVRAAALCQPNRHESELTTWGLCAQLQALLAPPSSTAGSLLSL